MIQLTSLPLELLHKVAHELCTHCSASSSPRHQNDLQTPFKGPLISLSLTCKLLQHVAQPHLPHSVTLEGENFAPVMRRLIANPEWGHSVKQLFVTGADPGYENGLTKEELGAMNLLLDEFDLDWDRMPLPSEEEDGMPRDTGSEQSFFETTCPALVAYFCPQVEYLAIESYYWTLPDLQRRFPKLHTLQLAHGDTEMGVWLNDLEGVMTSVPRLERIIGFAITRVVPMQHDGIKEVILRNSFLTNEDCRNLMGSFKNLERLVYEGGENTVGQGSGDPITPQQMSDALLIRRDTLRSVELIISRDGYLEGLDDGTSSEHGQSDFMGSLQEMKVLENLSVDSFFFHDEIEGDEDVGPDEEADYRNVMIDILPKSLQSFTVRPPTLLFQALLQLARHCGQGNMFPNLKLVRVWGIAKERRDTLEEEFKLAGVKLRGKPIEKPLYWMH